MDKFDGFIVGLKYKTIVKEFMTLAFNTVLNKKCQLIKCQISETPIEFNIDSMSLWQKPCKIGIIKNRQKIDFNTANCFTLKCSSILCFTNLCYIGWCHGLNKKNVKVKNTLTKN